MKYSLMIAVCHWTLIIFFITDSRGITLGWGQTNLDNYEGSKILRYIRFGYQYLDIICAVLLYIQLINTYLTRRTLTISQLLLSKFTIKCSFSACSSHLTLPRNFQKELQISSIENNNNIVTFVSNFCFHKYIWFFMHFNKVDFLAGVVKFILNFVQFYNISKFVFLQYIQIWVCIKKVYISIVYRWICQSLNVRLIKAWARHYFVQKQRRDTRMPVK